MSVDVFIVGLGNPEPRYFTSRHNIGFLFVDLFCKAKGLKFERKNDSLYAIYDFSSKKVCLIKPLTYMNNSGIAIRKWLGNLRVNCDNLMVIHDDIDLPFGKVRMKCGGGHGGHRGVESIILNISTDSFARLRIGVGRPPVRDRNLIVKWLLDPMRDEELEEYIELIKKLLPILDVYIESGFPKASGFLGSILR